MYSTDVVKENAYLSATRSGLESNEIATLQRSLPSRFNLRHLKKNESLKLVLQKKAGKSRVVAYKFTSGSFNYTAYRISDKKFYNLSDTSGKGSLDYPLPATARLSSPFNPARLNPVSGKVSPHNGIDYSMRKRAARTVLTGMCYSVGSATRQGSSSLTRFIGQSAMTSRT